MQPIISVRNLSKTYASGFRALKGIDLEIRRGEIFALLGPNGAGKTTLISTVCGIVNPTEGQVVVDGHDIVTNYRAARSLIGLVPQELTTDAFESVWATVSFSRGLFGKAADKKADEEEKAAAETAAAAPTASRESSGIGPQSIETTHIVGQNEGSQQEVVTGNGQKKTVRVIAPNLIPVPNPQN